MRRATGGLLVLAVLAACSDDADSGDGGAGESSEDMVGTATTSAELGEMVELGDNIFVAVDSFSVELLSDDHEQVIVGGGVEAPAIVADVRSENQGGENAATDTNPQLRTYCADRVDSLEDQPFLGPYTGLAPGNPDWLGDELPPGSSSEASLAVLAPGQQNIGAALPAELCDDPMLRFEPMSWPGDEARPGVDVRFPAEVLADYRSAHEEYMNAVSGEVDRDDVTVGVVNASGDASLAEHLTDRIEQLDYETVDPVDGPETTLVIMYYAAGYLDAAQELWESLVTEVPDDVSPEYAPIDESGSVGADGEIAIGDADLVLVLGSDFEE